MLPGRWFKTRAGSQPEVPLSYCVRHRDPRKVFPVTDLKFLPGSRFCLDLDRKDNAATLFCTVPGRFNFGERHGFDGNRQFAARCQ